MIAIAVALIACSAPPSGAAVPAMPAADDSGTEPDSGTSGVTTESEAPCTAVEAVFFDLGETLVTDIGGPFNPLFEPIDGAFALIDALLADSKRIGIITNTESGWDEQDLRALLTEPDMLDRFEVVLLSSQATADPKPDPAIFLEAHGMLPGAPPLSQTAFVTEDVSAIADDASNPTEGARAAGMVGVHLTDGASPLADYTHPPDQLATLADAVWLSCGE